MKKESPNGNVDDNELLELFQAVRQRKATLPERLETLILEDARRVQIGIARAKEIGREQPVLLGSRTKANAARMYRSLGYLLTSAVIGLGIGYASAESIELLAYEAFGVWSEAGSVDVFSGLEQILLEE